MNMKCFAAVAGILALAACDSATSTPASLKGKSFVADAAGSPITIMFDDTEMRVNGRVVNIYNGNYEIDGKKIKFGPMVTTMMMGTPDAMATERDYFVFLDMVETYDFNGERLTLMSSDGREIVFRPVQLNENADPVDPNLPPNEIPVIKVEKLNQE